MSQSNLPSSFLLQSRVKTEISKMFSSPRMTVETFTMFVGCWKSLMISFPGFRLNPFSLFPSIRSPLNSFRFFSKYNSINIQGDWVRTLLKLNWSRNRQQNVDIFSTCKTFSQFVKHFLNLQNILSTCKRFSQLPKYSLNLQISS